MKQWLGRIRAAFALAVLPLAAGCNGFFVYPGTLPGASSSTSTANNYVYVINQANGTLAGYAIGTGTLTSVSNGIYSLGYNPSAIAINPANSIAFVAGTSSLGLGAIYAYSINSDGTLSSLNNGSAVASGLLENSIDISPDGQWLIGLDADNTTLDEYTINSSTGLLNGPTLISYANPGGGAVNAKQIKFSPNGQLIYAALGTAGDTEFTFNTAINSGVIASVQQIPNTTTSSDNALALSPNGAYLYIARSGTTSALVAYSNAGSGGTLSGLTGSPFTAGTSPFAVVANSTNVYLANRGSPNASAISGFSVASSGALSTLNSYAGGSNVAALALDKTGKYLLAAASGGSPDLWLYSFDSAGNLLESTAITATGTGASGMAVTH